jgi:C1A family cysteine protease
MTLRKYGWQPDIPDKRDFLYQAIKPIIRLPKKVDLCQDCSKIEDQGKLGSCTAQALAGNLEFLDKKTDSRYIDVSRLFIYYNERLLMDTVDYDSGASLRIGIKTLKNDGACAETLWPYQIQRFDDAPPEKCYSEAKGHKITSYHRINGLREMLVCLAEGYPFVFGFTVYESFESPKVASTGEVSMPKKDERSIGGHAVMAAGYDQSRQRFLVRNSWGEKWGKKGLFWGYESVRVDSQTGFMALPEKALLDLIYFRGMKITGAWLRELRLQNTEKINPDKLFEYAKKFKSPGMLKAASQVQKYLYSYDEEEKEL